jgi:hypothetical protein
MMRRRRFPSWIKGADRSTQEVVVTEDLSTTIAVYPDLATAGISPGGDWIGGPMNAAQGRF